VALFVDMPASAVAAPRLALVAGEASGDLIAAMLLQGLQRHWPGLQASGIGGPRMQETGFTPWWPSDKLAVRGYIEVLRHYREIIGIRNQLAQRLLAQPPNLFMGIDAPDFNIALEERLKSKGICTAHFVSPSIWAWRYERVEKIKRSVDHMFCIFPFEPEIYAKEGIAATYVGHPLADAIPLEVPRTESRRLLGLSEEQTVVALLPGSRRSEIKLLTPRLLSCLQQMLRARPTLQFILPVADGLQPLIDAQLQVLTPQQRSHLKCVQGQSHAALAACNVAVVASGTATLEAALFKRPMVITYVLNWLEWQKMKRMNYLPWVGLPNILLRDFVVPELLQHQATGQALADAALRWLDAPEDVHRLQQQFVQLHHTLRQDTIRCTTQVLSQLLQTA
jgi:lipid-A-disaccharide synthase